MSYTPNNIQVFTAALSGAIAGIGASNRTPTSETPTVYSSLVLAAATFAQCFDTEWDDDPVDAYILQTIQQICQASWQDRYPALEAPFTTTPSVYTDKVQALIAIVQQGTTYLDGQAIVPPVSVGNISMQATGHVFFFAPGVATMVNSYNYTSCTKLAVGKFLFTMTKPVDIDPNTGFPMNIVATLALLEGPGMINFNNAYQVINYATQHIVETWDETGTPADLPFCTVVNLWNPNAEAGTFVGVSND